MKKIRKEQKVAQHRVLALLLGGILVVLIAYQEWLLHMPSYTWPFLWNRDAFLHPVWFAFWQMAMFFGLFVMNGRIWLQIFYCIKNKKYSILFLLVLAICVFSLYNLWCCLNIFRISHMYIYQLRVLIPALFIWIVAAVEAKFGLCKKGAGR